MPGAFDPSDPAAHPFTAFNFAVEIQVPGMSGKLANAAFSECDGLEMSMEPKTIREGGRNSGPVHMAGPVSYGQLTLKRGMTANMDLWRWFERVSAADNAGARGTVDVLMLGADRRQQLHFRLGGCLPTKLKASALNAKDGQIAIEEMQVAYESLVLV
ncbi:MAG TPA: phage tail protein [Longimicrobium sp.]|uniref:phage tail protein n=1 Tax=Longimicrobium sp. TaxID=2029185 RepID=UPI002ED9F903